MTIFIVRHSQPGPGGYKFIIELLMLRYFSQSEEYSVVLPISDQGILSLPFQSRYSSLPVLTVAHLRPLCSFQWQLGWNLPVEAILALVNVTLIFSAISLWWQRYITDHN